MRIVLSDFPMPPTENHCYPTVWSKHLGKYIRVESGELKQFKRDVGSWVLSRRSLINEASKLLQQGVQDRRHQIMVDAYLAFPPGEIWTKDGHVKKMDASNRIKPLHDGLADAIEIDDKYYISGRAEKVATRSHPCVMLILTLQPFRSLEQALEDEMEKLAEGSCA